jgi:sulfopyruvate decarboxylase TPP-binding subunit
MDAELAKLLVKSLHSAGIDFVTFLPETRLSQILPYIRETEGMELVPTSSEWEAVLIAAGAALAGKQAACYLESTGLYVASYPLLVVGRQVGVPVLLVVGFLGGFTDQRNSFLYATIGRHAKPHLDGLGIEYDEVVDGQNLETRVKNAVRTMNAQRSPVALFCSGEFTI